VTDPLPANPPPPHPPTARRIEIELALRTGWGRGAAAAGIVFVLVYAMNVVLTLIQQTYGPAAGSLADVPQGALASLYLWHGASFEVDLGALAPQGGPLPGSFGVTFSSALILGTFVVVWMLFVAGRHLGRAFPVPLWLQPVRWAQVAIPYSLLALFLSPLARLSEAVPLPQGATEGGGIEIGVSPMSALGMAFLLATAAAGAGVAGTGVSAMGAGLRRVVGAIAGGWRMLWVALALAVAGFLVVAALHPDVTRAYLELVSRDGVLGIIRGAILTVFFLGNVGVYVAAAAAGTGIGFSALGESCTLLSYLSFPRGTTGPPPGSEALPDPCASLPLDVGAAPLPYLLFLLVPVLATVVGGRRAAAHAEVVGGGDGAVVGAAAAVPFTALFVGFGALADVSYEVDVILRVSVALGPSLIPLFLLALLWGAAGGAIGGWLTGRAAAERTSVGGPPEGTTGFEPETTTGPG